MSAFVDERRADFGVEPICGTLGVSASAYYHRKSGNRSPRVVEDERLLPMIRLVAAENYGSPGVIVGEVTRIGVRVEAWV